MKKYAWVLCFLVLALPSTAFTQWYVGATGGQYELDTNGWDWDSSATISTRGGYRFNRFLSLEGSYVFFGETEADGYYYTHTLEGGLFDFGVVGTIPIGKHFEIFGRAGLGYWAVDVDDWGYNSEDTGSAWNYGGGLSINFNRNWSIFGGYQKYEFDVDYGDLSADTVYAGVKFYFDFSSGSKSGSGSKPATVYEPQKIKATSNSLRAVSVSEKENCRFINTLTFGSGGPGTASAHLESAKNKAIDSAAKAGADSYYVVSSDSTSSGATVILEALDCN